MIAFRVNADMNCKARQTMAANVAPALAAEVVRLREFRGHRTDPDAMDQLIVHVDGIIARRGRDSMGWLWLDYSLWSHEVVVYDDDSVAMGPAIFRDFMAFAGDQVFKEENLN